MTIKELNKLTGAGLGNWVLNKLKRDLLQSKFNLQKEGLYLGLLKERIEELLKALEDYND